jgi:hypothetical protein
VNDPQYSSAPPPGSPNIILAIVSAALGALGLLFMIPTLLFTPCGIISFGLGVGSVITGLLARSRAKADPVHWGGAGLAIGGVLAGAVSVIAPIAYIIIVAILMFGIMAIGHAGK